MGSRLRRSAKTSADPPGAPIWDPDSKGTMLGLAWGSLDKRMRLFDPTLTVAEPIRESANETASGEDAGLAVPRLSSRTTRGWGTVAWKFYGKALVELQQAFEAVGGVVFAFGYDWRLDNRENGRRLLAFIEEEIAERDEFACKPLVVTHSMGGLVTRAACCERHAGTLGESMIGAIIHTMMPTFGTPDAVASFRLGQGAKLWPVDGVADTVLSRILGNTADQFAFLGCGVPSLFQLMPSDRFPDAGSSVPELRWMVWSEEVEQRAAGPGPFHLGHPWAVYLERTGTLGLVNHERYREPELEIEGVLSSETHDNPGLRLSRLIENVKAARLYHEKVGAYRHPHTWVVSSDEVETVVGLSLDTNILGAIRPKRRESEDGDGTVDLRSAEGLGPAGSSGGLSRLSGVEHAAGLVDSRMIAQVISDASDAMAHVRNATW